MTTKPSGHSIGKGNPPPSCRRRSRLAKACFFGSAIKVPLPIRPLCAHVEGHNLGGCGKPPKLRPPARGAGAPERGDVLRAVAYA